MSQPLAVYGDPLALKLGVVLKKNMFAPVVNYDV
jgi:hypothetical protein